MVCLNIQTGDESLLINKVFFKRNGGKRGGYILKPPYMRGEKELSLSHVTVCELSIISTQLISKNLIKGEKDVMEVYLRGHKKDEAEN